MGGFEVKISWRNGRLSRAKIRSLNGQLCRVKSFTTDCDLDLRRSGKTVALSPQNGIVEFGTEIGETYVLIPAVG